VGQSIMPAYKFLFDVKSVAERGDMEITVPDEFRKGITGKIVARKEAMQLVAYLQSLKQAKLYNEAAAPEFLYKKESKPSQSTEGSEAGEPALDGASLYSTHCQSCHQANGEGLKGAFPPLKGSPILMDENSKLLIDIIMNGYDARPEFAIMPAVGSAANLSADEVAAIINHERTSWGNKGVKLPAAEVKKITELLSKK
jgi:cytochrome c oxidase cbb3-type subunit 2